MVASTSKTTLYSVRSALLRNARIIDPVQNMDQLANLVIREGKIKSIEVGLKEKWESMDWDLEKDMQGKIICPSFIDVGCFIPEPGYEQKGTLKTELTAALDGGYSHLLSLPNTLPIADSPAVISLMLDRSSAYQGVQLLPLGALTQGLLGEQLSEMHALKAAGCVGVTNARFGISDQRVLMRCLEYASTYDLRVFFFSEDMDLAAEGYVHEGCTADRLGLSGIPPCAETVAVARNLLLVEHTQVRAHFCQITCARSVQLIAAAQKEGLAVTADVGIPHLFYTDEEVSGYNSHFHLRPPIRSELDRQGLLSGLKRGVFSAISSTHYPHERAAKMAPFGDTAAGMSTFATQVHWAGRLVDKGELTWLEWIRGMTGAAELIEADVGHLRVGSTASLNLIDPEVRWQLSEDAMVSRGKNSPLLNQDLKGRVLGQVRGISGK